MWVLQIGGDLDQICKDFMTTVAIKESLNASKDDARLVHEVRDVVVAVVVVVVVYRLFCTG